MAAPLLQVRGPTVISRYYNSDSAGADAGGWFSTGDVATIDPAGHMQASAPMPRRMQR